MLKANGTDPRPRGFWPPRTRCPRQTGLISCLQMPPAQMPRLLLLDPRWDHHPVCHPAALDYPACRLHRCRHQVADRLHCRPAHRGPTRYPTCLHHPRLALAWEGWVVHPECVHLCLHLLVLAATIPAAVRQACECLHRQAGAARKATTAHLVTTAHHVILLADLVVRTDMGVPMDTEDRTDHLVITGALRTVVRPATVAQGGHHMAGGVLRHRDGDLHLPHATTAEEETIPHVLHTIMGEEETDIRTSKIICFVF
jgi:hypothetical protein